MKITIDTDILDEYRLTLSEFLRLYSIRLNRGNDNTDLINLVLKGFLEKSLLSNDFILQPGVSKLIEMVETKSVTRNDYDNFNYDYVYDEIINLYPRGVKIINGYTSQWRLSRREFKDRMIGLFKKFKYYNEEDVIKAFKQYNSEAGNDKRVLKNTIWEEFDKGEPTSIIATIIDSGFNDKVYQPIGTIIKA